MMQQGVRLKFGRAWEHFDHLEDLVEPFLNAQREKITSEFEPDRLHKVFWLRDPDEPKPEWNPIIGDILYNLRSSLDHLAWALVEANGRLGTSKVQFPIHSNPRRFQCSGEPLIARMSKAAKAGIEAAQPYNRGHRVTTQALSLLDDLGNVDKHRHFNLIVIGQRGGSGPPEVFDRGSFNFAPVNGDTILARIALAGKMDVDYLAHLDISFGQIEPPLGSFGFIFNYIREEVGRVITDLSALIP